MLLSKVHILLCIHVQLINLIKKVLGYITYSTLYFIFHIFWTYVRVLLLLLVLQSTDWLSIIIVLFAKCVTNFKHLTTPFACCQTLPPPSTTPLRHQYLTWHCQIYKKKWCWKEGRALKHICVCWGHDRFSLWGWWQHTQCSDYARDCIGTGGEGQHPDG